MSEQKFPFSNQADLLTNGPRIEYGERYFDAAGYERTERRTGAYQCPCCDLWWPVIEEPDCWEEGLSGLWKATGWWGAGVCSECDLLMIEQPDGSYECYELDPKPD